MKNIKRLVSKIIIPVIIVVGINIFFIFKKPYCENFFHIKYIEVVSTSITAILAYISIIIASSIDKKNGERNAKNFVEEEIIRFQNKIASAIEYVKTGDIDIKEISMFCNSFANYIYFIKKVKYEWQKDISEKMNSAESKVNEVRTVLDYLYDLASFKAEQFIKSLDDLTVLLIELRVTIINSDK